MRRSIFIATLSLGVLLWVGPSRAGGDLILVIANKDVPVNSLDRNDLRPIFQVVKLQWPNGNGIVPLNLPDDSSLRHDFDQAVLGLSPDRVARYWIDKKIRGDTHPPKKLTSPEAVARAVAKTPGAIGYVAAGDVSSSVKVVARIQDGKVAAP
jgi:ABC-type phosphate transport system substrate-binding protein